MIFFQNFRYAVEYGISFRIYEVIGVANGCKLLFNHLLGIRRYEEHGSLAVFVPALPVLLVLGGAG